MQNAKSQDVTLHSVDAAAKILGCSGMHVYRLIAARELMTVDIAMPGAGRTKTRIRSDDLANYINNRTRAETRHAAD